MIGWPCSLPRVGVLSLAVGGLPGALAAAAPDSATYDRAVVRVVAQSSGGEILGTGSGFFVDERHVVANHHVVADAQLGANPLISIVLAEGRDWLPVRVRWADEGLARALDGLDLQYVRAGDFDTASQPPTAASVAEPGTSNRYLWLTGLLAPIVVGALLLYRHSRRLGGNVPAGAGPAKQEAAPSQQGERAGARGNPASSALPPSGAPAASRPALRSGPVRLTGRSGAPHVMIDTAELRRAAHGHSFGRLSDLVDHSLAVEGLSRRHFRISTDRGRTFLEDLNSTNGTFVNGDRLVPYRARQLRVDDEITAGVGRWRVAGLE